MFEIPTFGIPTFIIPIEKYSHNTNAPIIIPMPLSKYQCPIQNTHDACSKYQLKVRNTNKLKRVQFIKSKYQQIGILNTVHNTMVIAESLWFLLLDFFSLCVLKYLPFPKGEGKAPEWGHFASSVNSLQ